MLFRLQAEEGTGCFRTRHYGLFINIFQTMVYTTDSLLKIMLASALKYGRSVRQIKKERRHNVGFVFRKSLFMTKTMLFCSARKRCTNDVLVQVLEGSVPARIRANLVFKIFFTVQSRSLYVTRVRVVENAYVIPEQLLK